MKLLLDVGNSSVKWALSEGGRFTCGGRFAHRNGNFALLAEQAWSGLQPGSVVAASVAGAALGRQLEDWSQRHWRLTPRWLQTTASAAGVHNGYAEAQALGIDRWAAMVGAFVKYRAALCVVDCGTAITLDLVEADGSHRGGLILPGIGLMQAALRGNTANLAAAAHATGALQLLAVTTGDAIASGSVYAAVAAIGQISRRMAAQCVREPLLLLTGGDAERVMPLLDAPCKLEPELVLHGLDILSGER
jgi:type III pantothenate kinase